jgi:hypothetical protein
VRFDTKDFLAALDEVIRESVVATFNRLRGRVD